MRRHARTIAPLLVLGAVGPLSGCWLLSMGTLLTTSDTRAEGLQATLFMAPITAGNFALGPLTSLRFEEHKAWGGGATGAYDDLRFVGKDGRAGHLYAYWGKVPRAGDAFTCIAPSPGRDEAANEVGLLLAQATDASYVAEYHWKSEGGTVKVTGDAFKLVLSIDARFRPDGDSPPIATGDYHLRGTMIVDPYLEK